MSRYGRRTMLGAVAALGVLLVHPALAESAPIDVNTASAAELATIKGIGAAKAQAIVDHREQNGGFQSVDDLKLVRGIGDKMLEQLRPQVTVGGGAAGAAPAVGSGQASK